MKKQLVITIVCVSLLLGLFNATSPRSLPSVVLFAVLGLVYITITQLCILLLMLTRYAIGAKWRTSIIRRVSYSGALLPAFLLLLQSVGQLTLRDTALAVALTVLAFLYSQRMVRISPEKKVE